MRWMPSRPRPDACVVASHVAAVVTGAVVPPCPPVVRVTPTSTARRVASAPTTERSSRVVAPPCLRCRVGGTRQLERTYCGCCCGGGGGGLSSVVFLFLCFFLHMLAAEPVSGARHTPAQTARNLPRGCRACAMQHSQVVPSSVEAPKAGGVLSRVEGPRGAKQAKAG